MSGCFTPAELPVQIHYLAQCECMEQAHIAIQGKILARIYMILGLNACQNTYGGAVESG